MRYTHLAISTVLACFCLLQFAVLFFQMLKQPIFSRSSLSSPTFSNDSPTRFLHCSERFIAVVPLFTALHLGQPAVCPNISKSHFLIRSLVLVSSLLLFTIPANSAGSAGSRPFGFTSNSQPAPRYGSHNAPLSSSKSSLFQRLLFICFL